MHPAFMWLILLVIKTKLNGQQDGHPCSPSRWVGCLPAEPDRADDLPRQILRDTEAQKHRVRFPLLIRLTFRRASPGPMPRCLKWCHNKVVRRVPAGGFLRHLPRHGDGCRWREAQQGFYGDVRITGFLYFYVYVPRFTEKCPVWLIPPLLGVVMGELS